MYNKIILLTYLVCYNLTAASKDQPITEYGPAISRKEQTINLKKDQSNGDRDNKLSFGFGSCYMRHDPEDQNTIFRQIKQEDLDLWIWLGDATYGDDCATFIVGCVPTDIKTIEKKYAATEGDIHYQELAEKVKVIGVWDDHDFGVNNSNKTYRYKNETRKMFMDFIREPEDSERRLQKDSAIFQDYFIINDSMNVHLILLDNRFDNDAIKHDLLGEDQWKWLDQALAKTQIQGNPIDLTLVASGLQILPDRPTQLSFSDMEIWSWQNKEKLYSMLTKHRKSNTILMSGDMHLAQLYQSKCASLNGYRLPEISSSGMTHTDSDIHTYINMYTPDFWTMSEMSTELNYGKVDIYQDQSSGDNFVKMSLLNDKGKVIFDKEYNLSQGDLQYSDKKIRNSQLCIAKNSQQRTHIWFLYVVQELIVKKNVYGFGVILIPLVIFTIPATLITYLGVKILRIFNK